MAGKIIIAVRLAYVDNDKRWEYQFLKIDGSWESLKLIDQLEVKFMCDERGDLGLMTNLLVSR